MCGIVGLDMKMSCNGCRVLRKGCSDDCIIRPCLYWIKNAESQANATVFLAKFYGRAGLMNLISAGPEHLRPAIFKSLLYEACGRLANPINGSIGLLSSGNWQVCQQAVDNILKGTPIEPLHLPSTPGTIEEATTNTKPGQSTLMEAIANELHKVKTKGRFKKNNRRNTTTIISNEEDSVEEENAASQVSNLRGRRCYPGENLNTISSDSSCETHNHDYTTDKDYNAKTKFSMPLEVPKEEMKPPCNSNTDVELELTLSSHTLGETHKQRRQVHDEQREKVHDGGGGLLLSEEYCKTMHCSSSSMFASSGLGLGLAAT